jgi:hypothetical protein
MAADDSLPSMKTADPTLVRQLPHIRKIIEDETWLEGERRGCAVERKDPVVLERVCAVVLRVGQELRQLAEAQAQQ